MKRAYIVSLIIVNVVLLITLISVAIFSAYPNIHQALQNICGGSGPCIPINVYWKIHIVYVLLSPAVAILFTPMLWVAIEDN